MKRKEKRDRMLAGFRGVTGPGHVLSGLRLTSAA